MMNKHRKWTDSERRFMVENANMKDVDAVALFERLFEKSISLYAYQKERRKMGVKKRRGRGLSEVVYAIAKEVQKEMETETLVF